VCTQCEVPAHFSLHGCLERLYSAPVSWLNNLGRPYLFKLVSAYKAQRFFYVQEVVVMARTPVKRRSRNTHSVAQLQKRHAPSGETQVLQRLRERKTRRNVGVEKSYKSISNEPSQTNGTTARQGRSGENPAASFLGLPTEVCVGF
jgi:hypothetical protein